MIPFSADFEKKVLDLGPEEGAKFCAEVGVKSAFPRIIKSGYHAINLSHYFTVRQHAVLTSAPPCARQRASSSSLCCRRARTRCARGQSKSTAPRPRRRVSFTRWVASVTQISAPVLTMTDFSTPARRISRRASLWPKS